MRKHGARYVQIPRLQRVGCALALAMACMACSDDDNKYPSPAPLDAGHDAGGGGAIDASLDAQMPHSDASAPVVDAGGSKTGNLIVNGNAEAAAGSTTAEPVDTPAWTSTGEATALAYGAADYPSRGDVQDPDPGPPDRGNNLFIGGQSDELSTLAQTVSLSSYASAIDTGSVHYTLDGWLGGFSSQGDNAVLTATFKDAGGASLGMGTLGPVTADDRMNVTSLLERSTTGVVPVGARSVAVLLTLTRTEGSANDGYADDLSLVLSGI